MKPKYIFLVIVTVLVTIILMKNTDEVKFWIFGDRYVQKLAVLGTMFGLGLVFGFILGRPRKKKPVENTSLEGSPVERKELSAEDEEYIK
ncbi:hypothetical protein [Hufsiella ginkgonis]|uniref:DUF1049 domain-containing protein n=1 Tax=Hufsiella ginkgonis TaxID=2695274 RepID=A0A7K1XYD0_9SPHI|nr:hypothetical protein [Hufsiella ginkgonis]MXV16001.1 hypothetical protein [Hufsiella ginkgonis]